MFLFSSFEIILITSWIIKVVVALKDLNFVLILNDNPESHIYRGKLEPAIDIGIEYFNILNGPYGYRLIKHVIVYPSKPTPSNRTRSSRPRVTDANLDNRKSVAKRNNVTRSNTFYPFQTDSTTLRSDAAKVQLLNFTLVSNGNVEEEDGGSEERSSSDIYDHKKVYHRDKERPQIFQGWGNQRQDLRTMYVCDPAFGVGHLADLMHRVNLSFVLGPPCSRDMRVIAPVAAYYGLPICSGYSVFDNLDLGKYPTMTRLSFSTKSQVWAVHELLKRFGHHEVLLICDVRWNRAKELAIDLNEQFKTDGYFADFRTIYFDGTEKSSFKPKAFLERARSSTKGPKALLFLKSLVRELTIQSGDKQEFFCLRQRICIEIWRSNALSIFSALSPDPIIIMSDEAKMRALLVMADTMGLGNGHFLFIAIELYPGSPIPRTLWSNGDKLDVVAKRVYNTLLIIGLKQPQGLKWEQFSFEVKRLALLEYDYLHNGPVNYFIGAFHDCVLMYAKTFNLFSRPEKGSADDHVIQISPNKFWNNSFEGVSGTIRLDQFGDRLADFTIYGMVNRFSGTFEPIATYYGHTRTIDFVSNVDWIGSVPPSPNPVCLVTDQLTNVTSYKNCGYEGAKVNFRHTYNFKIFMAVLAFVAMSCAVILLVYVYRKKRDKENYMRLEKWKIDAKDLFAGSGRRSSSSLTFNSTKNFPGMHGVYKGVTVHLKHFPEPQVDMTSGKFLNEIRQIHQINHENLTLFLGLCQTKNAIVIVTEMVSKMSLLDLLAKERLEIDHVLQFSIINDILKGMIYLHASKIRYHGRLRSSHVLIDNRFSAKITAFGLGTLYEQAVKNDFIRGLDYKLQLPWMAPECLRQEQPVVVSGQAADVYSFAIVLTEIVTRKPPYYYNYTDYQGCECQVGPEDGGPDLDPFDVFRNKGTAGRSQTNLAQGKGSYLHFLLRAMRRVKEAQRPPYRPLLGPSQNSRRPRNGESDMVRFEPAAQTNPANTKRLRVLVEMCWDENPITRATFPHIHEVFKGLSKNINFGNMIEILLERMEDYTKSLEGMIWQKTKDLVQEKERVDQFLFQILPRPIAEELKAGVSVEPEEFRNVTIYMSDIVKFTVLSSTSTALEIVNFLNDVYCCFDGLVEKVDAYKVETIGDAYMVASGLPKRNGNKHFREVARFALSIVKTVSNFKIRHKPGESMQVRIGIHTGSCAAGIVGIKMPRYCLFGTTVNIAEKMESSGEAMRIHVSESTKTGLDDFKEFKTEQRGTIELEGKGTLKTYWLSEQKDEDQQQFLSPLA